MKPHIDLAIVLQQASVLLGEPLADARAAELGADHLVVFATAPGCGRVVIKVGEDATTDAYVLDQLRDIPALVPQPLACGIIVAERQSYPAVVMTRVAGVDLATVPEQHRYLPELVAQLCLVHRLTTAGAAGTVRDVVQGCAPASWKTYLRDILGGRNKEFDWENLYRSPLVDAKILRRAVMQLGEELEELPDTRRYHLLHGDLNPANVLVAGGRLAGIIDWSYARYGDPLFDFARLRMNPFVRRSPEATEAYFALLDLSAEERAREDFYFRFNLVEYVHWYIQSQAVDRVREHIALLAELISLP